VRGDDPDVHESCRLKTLAVLGEGQGSGDATDVVAAPGALPGCQVVVGHDVRDADAAARCQEADGARCTGLASAPPAERRVPALVTELAG
jgi:hypothetical protein